MTIILQPKCYVSTWCLC